MKIKKLLLLTISSALILLILSGCSNANISLRLRPNPIEFSEGQTKKELSLEVKTEGLGSISLNKMIVEVIDQDDQRIFSEEKDIDISAPLIVGGFSDTVSYTLDLEKIFELSDYGYQADEAFSVLYTEVLQGKTHSLRVSLTGSNNTALTAQIIYN